MALGSSKYLALFLLCLSANEVHAQETIDSPELQIEGHYKGDNGDDKKGGDPTHSHGRDPAGSKPVGSKPTLQSESEEDKKKRIQNENIASFKASLDSAGLINLDVLTREVSGPGGSILWIMYEIAVRALDPTDTGTHPMENPDSFKFDAYRIERVLQLRKDLDKEAEEAWKEYRKKKTDDKLPLFDSLAMDPSKRTLNNKEMTIVRAARIISPDAEAIAELIIRYGRNDSLVRLPSKSPALLSFDMDIKIPVANACYSAQTKSARMVPYTAPGRSCASYFDNGTPTTYPGVTVVKSFSNTCSVSWGKCTIPNKDIAGAKCGCVDPFATSAMTVLPVTRGKVVKEQVPMF